MGLCCILADAAARLCVGKPAVRGRGRRDAVATQHRLTQGSPSCYSSQTEGTVCCNMTSAELSGKLSVQQHPRLRGERTRVSVRRFCANRLRSTFSQHCAKCEASKRGMLLHVELKEKPRPPSLIISCSASCKPEHDHQPTMPLSASWYHLARPLLRHYAHLSTWSFSRSFLIKPSFDPDRRLNRVLWLFCALFPSLLFLHPSSSGRFF